MEKRRGRKPATDKGVRVSIYLRKSQMDWLDAECKKKGVTRTKIIEEKLFPKGLQILTTVHKSIN